MDINPDGSYQPINDFIEIQTIYDSNFESSITTSCFDDTQELLWTGNSEVFTTLKGFFKGAFLNMFITKRVELHHITALV